MNSGLCVYCKKLLSEAPIVEVENVMRALVNASILRKDGLLTPSMTSVVLHVHCRKRYTDIRSFDKENTSANTRANRLFMSNVFDFKMDCLFCSNRCVKDVKHPDRSQDVHQVVRKC